MSTVLFKMYSRFSVFYRRSFGFFAFRDRLSFLNMPLKILREFFLKKVELCFHVSLSHHNFIRGVRALQVAHLSLIEACW
jgi:hypothetical protein